VKDGFHSYWKQGGKSTALEMDDVVALKRAAKQENAWVMDNELIPMEDWLRRYAAWQS